MKYTKGKVSKWILLSFVGVLLIAVPSLSSQQREEPVLSIEKCGAGLKSHQSATVYGHYLVAVGDSVFKFTLYDMMSRKVLTKVRPVPKRERNKSGQIIFHANNCFFGKQKYKEQDSLPLLYVSHRENNENRGVLEVYRLTLISKKGNEKIDTMSVNLVQTIYFPPATDENALGSPWACIDETGTFLYTYSRNNRKRSSNYNLCRISQFRIPDSKYSVVRLSDDDRMSSFSVNNYKIGLSQGACMYNGKMYIMQGVPSRGSLLLRVLDMNRKELEKTVNLRDLGIKEEPEGCFVYNDTLHFTTNNGNIYRFNNIIGE